MTDFDGFASIEALFYTVFHPTEGTKVSQQVPMGSIVTPQKQYDDIMEPLFDFDLVKNYIIPKPALCDRLITLKVGQYRIVGYPVSITSTKYARNSFSFNFCFVFNYDTDTTPYESSIKRLGRLFKNLEEQNRVLSKIENDSAYFRPPKKKVLNDQLISGELSKANASLESSAYDLKQGPGDDDGDDDDEEDEEILSSTPVGISIKARKSIELNSIESLIQQIFQDLNNYSECLIPIDNGNSVDIKLLPLLPPPPKIYPEDVPISTVNLSKLVDVNWDPTMLKLLPFINGINSVKKISKLVNGDYFVVKTAIQHLMYYKCIILTDIFQFSNIYAPTYDIDLFLRDNHMAAECQGYVISPSLFKKLPFEASPVMAKRSANLSTESLNARNPYSALSLLGPSKASKQRVILPSKAKLFFLYRSLHQGQTVKQWYKEHISDLTYIDIRKFITFGVLRGLIYRVQSYPTIDSILQQDTHSNPDALFSHFSFNEPKPSSMTPGELTPSRAKRASSITEQQKKQLNEIVKHIRNVDTFDSICTDLELNRKTVDSSLRKIGHHNIINS